MDTAELLFRQILDCPEDDNIKLIYADHLQEEGAEDRANLIRWMIEGERNKVSKSAKYRKMSLDLVNVYPEWLPVVVDGVLKRQFRKGLIHLTVRCLSDVIVEEWTVDQWVWNPTPWAKTLCQYPVVSVAAEDKVPFGGTGQGSTGKYGWQKWSVTTGIWGAINRNRANGYAVPDPIFDRLRGLQHPEASLWECDDPETAERELGYAVAKWVREVGE